jgi:hypothetical protein
MDNITSSSSAHVGLAAQRGMWQALTHDAPAWVGMEAGTRLLIKASGSKLLNYVLKSARVD